MIELPSRWLLRAKPRPDLMIRALAEESTLLGPQFVVPSTVGRWRPLSCHNDQGRWKSGVPWIVPEDLALSLHGPASCSSRESVAYLLTLSYLPTHTRATPAPGSLSAKHKCLKVYKYCF